MGRESGFTYEQVAAIADVMKAAGANPTSRAVRERLGNTGSMGTINKMLQTWKQGQERAIASALSLPSPVQRTILEFMGHELATAKAALEIALAEEQQEAADLATENERQAAELDAAGVKLLGVQTELATYQGRILQVEAELLTAQTVAERERNAAEKARIDLAKVQLRLEAMPRLEQELLDVRALLDTERAGRVAAEQQAAVLDAQLVACRQRGDEADVRLTSLSTRNAEIEIEVRAAGAELAKAAAALQASEQRAAVLAAQLEASDKRGVEIEGREKTALARLAELERQAGGIAANLATANLQVQACQARLESAARELDSARELTKDSRLKERAALEETAELRGMLLAERTALGELRRQLDNDRAALVEVRKQLDDLNAGNKQT